MGDGIFAYIKYVALLCIIRIIFLGEAIELWCVWRRTVFSVPCPSDGYTYGWPGGKDIYGVGCCHFGGKEGGEDEVLCIAAVLPAS